MLDVTPTCAAPRAKGRPREFCPDAALAAALGVFWARGYEGASMAELTEAMGITKPSLYAAFGNKEALFGKALDLYEREKLAYTRIALEQPTARAVAEYLMRGALANQCSAEGPKGCMGVIASTACGTDGEGVKAEIIKRRACSRDALVARFERARDEGDLPSHVDPEALCGYLFTILQGMAVQAGAGASHDELSQVVETGLMLWPSR